MRENFKRDRVQKYLFIRKEFKNTYYNPPTKQAVCREKIKAI